MPLPAVTISDFLSNPNYNWAWGDDANGVAFSPSGRYALSSYSGSRASYLSIDFSTDTVTINSDGTHMNLLSAALDDDGTVYGTNTKTLYRIPSFGVGSPTALYVCPYYISYARLFIMPDNSKKIVFGTYSDGVTYDTYVHDVATGVTTVMTNPSTDTSFAFFGTHHYVQDRYGDVWDISYDTGALGVGRLAFWRVVANGAGTAAADFTIVSGLVTGTHIALEAIHTPSGWVIAVSGGKQLYLFNENTYAVIATRAYSASGVYNLLDHENHYLSYLPAGMTSFWLPGSANTTSTMTHVEKIQASDLTTLDTKELHTDWTVSDTIDVSSFKYSPYRNALVSTNDGSFGTEFVVIRPFTTAEGGGGVVIPPPGVVDENVKLRVWGFNLDGHDFYVLRVGPSETLVYDLTTDKWSSWASPAATKWRAHIGQNWIGMGSATFLKNFGSDIVAGDDTTGTLWVLDPTQGMDDNTDTGSAAFAREVTGGVNVAGRDVLPCGAVTLDLAVGNPVTDGYTVGLSISDDLGKSWLSCGSVALTNGVNNTVVEWRGLGTIKAPGRIFKITDTGATARIGALNLR